MFDNTNITAGTPASITINLEVPSPLLAKVKERAATLHCDPGCYIRSLIENDLRPGADETTEAFLQVCRLLAPDSTALLAENLKLTQLDNAQFLRDAIDALSNYLSTVDESDTGKNWAPYVVALGDMCDYMDELPALRELALRVSDAGRLEGIATLRREGDAVHVSYQSIKSEG